jgi:putative phosphoesterase
MPPAYGVRGNIDSDAGMPLIRRIDAAGRLVIAAHGHRYPLGEGLSCLVRAAKDEGARAFFFGHTHIPHFEERSGVAILNPGSLSRPRGPWGPSLAIVEAPDSSSCIDAKFYELVGTASSPRLKPIRL